MFVFPFSGLRWLGVLDWINSMGHRKAGSGL